MTTRDQALEKLKEVLLYDQRPDVEVSVYFWEVGNPEIGLRIAEISWTLKGAHRLRGSSSMQCDNFCAPVLFAAERYMLAELLCGQHDLEAQDCDDAKANLLRALGY